LRNTTPVLAALLLVGCVGSSEPDALELLFSGQTTILDLTHSVSAEAPYWPGPESSPFTHDTIRAHPDGRPSMAAYSVPEHYGTHLDAPIHSAPGLASVDQLLPTQLFGPAAVIDITAQVRENPDYALSMNDVRDWESRNGLIPDGAIVLVRTGWSDFWEQPERYYGADEDGLLHFPGLSAAAATLLNVERDVSGVGIDSGSVDPGSSADFAAHGILNGGGAFHLENLANLAALPERGAYLVVAPIKIAGGSGGQVRVFGIIPD
jgi:kynurenine formamidase